MLKKYKSWNMFERRWFWSLLVLTTLGFYSVFIFKNIISLIIFELILIFSGIFIYKSLSRQEKEWKGFIIDPITKKEVIS